MSVSCILVLGGSFDPVHAGHVGLAHYCATLLHPDHVRLIPAGQPWQKPELTTPAEDRMAMLKLAFAHCAIPVQFDDQEILRTTPSYTIDTLRSLRSELGDKVSIVLAMGADQLANLHTWYQWQKLFDYANLCIATRPGFLPEQDNLPAEVAREFSRRKASAAQLRSTPGGLVHLANNLALDVSATAIRQALQQDKNTDQLLPRAVLDYIHQHHLYKN